MEPLHVQSDTKQFAGIILSCYRDTAGCRQDALLFSRVQGLMYLVPSMAPIPFLLREGGSAA